MKARILWVSVLVMMMSGLGNCNFPGDCKGDMVVDDYDFGLTGPDSDYSGALVAKPKVPPLPKNFNYKGKMINIPAGSFLMGNNGYEYGFEDDGEHPQHWVTLSAYSIGKYEVTRGEYRQFMNAGGYTNSAYWSTDGWSWKVSSNRTEPRYWAARQNWYESPPQPFTQTDNHPVVGMTYYEAEAFCNWAGGHLPTEAQWEKAARWDGHPRVYPWGDNWDQEKCNNWDDSLYPRYQTAPVGSYPAGASPYGCQDMAGNVYEWCKDWYDNSYYSSSPSNDPPGPSSGSLRVLRGGVWHTVYDFPYACRSANRMYCGPGEPWGYLGFRLAR
jgi:iron(II)-dependent oxidoreductase